MNYFKDMQKIQIFWELKLDLQGIICFYEVYITVTYNYNCFNMFYRFLGIYDGFLSYNQITGVDDRKF